LETLNKIFPKGDMRNAIIEIIISAFSFLDKLRKTIPHELVYVFELRVLEQVGLLQDRIWKLHKRVHGVQSVQVL
jgi:hypothetical protein